MKEFITKTEASELSGLELSEIDKLINENLLSVRLDPGQAPKLRRSEVMTIASIICPKTKG